MRKSFRLDIEGIYTDALKSIRVRVTKVTAHKDASATVPTSEKATAAIKGLPGVEIISEGAASITFRIPAALEYANANPPNFTEAEREQQAKEREERKAARAAKRAAGMVDDEAGVEMDDDASDETE